MVSLITDKKELPKAFGNSQAPYTELTNLKQKQDRAEVRKGFEKQMEGLIEMYLASLKNQDPFSEKSNTESGVQIAGTTATISSLNQISEQIEDLIDNSKKSQLLNAAEFQGQEVYYDDSIREYRGHDLEFNYQLKAPNHLPADAPLKTTVKIYDERGIVVFSTRVDQAVIGKNKFLWHGKDNNGKEVKKGQYKIEVTSSSPMANGLSSIPIEATTYLSGMVEAIDTQDDAVKLLVNGKLIDQHLVKKMVKGESKAKLNQQPFVDQYVGYIGKNVLVDLSRLDIKGGKAEIAIKNSVVNHGKVKLEVYGDNAKYIKTIDYPAVPDNGKLALDGIKYHLPDGEYTCKVYVEDKDNDNQMILLETTDQIDVTSVDLAAGQISDGNKIYNLKNIQSVTGSSALESSLITQGGYFVGKQVHFVDNSLIFNGESGEIVFPIDKILHDRILTEAKVEIYKKGQSQPVKEITIGVNKLYEPLPTFDALNDNSKAIINNLIASNPLTLNIRSGLNNYTDLDDAEQSIVDNYIKQQFRAGNLFKMHQDENDKDIQLKNKGIIEVKMDGALASPADLASSKQEYTYKITTITTNKNNNDLQKDVVNNYNQAFVKECTVIDSALKLVLSGDKEISIDDVIAVGYL